jgi:hypothetical protein
MHSRILRGAALTAATALLAFGSARATTLRHMSLKDLSTSADRIFRGTVVGIDEGTVTAGGGELPTVTYRLRVEEQFKGEFASDRDQAVVELRMLGSLKAASASGSSRRGSIFRDLPKLKMGEDYVLFTTRPSSIGLSTTVGLGQGAFDIYGAGKTEEAVNAFGNVGLGGGANLPSSGPVSYDQLARAIRAVLSE